MEGFPRSPSLAIGDGFAWPATVSFQVPRDWKSGVYIASFPTAQGIRGNPVRRSPARSQRADSPDHRDQYLCRLQLRGRQVPLPLSVHRPISQQLVTFERPLQPDIMGGFYAWDQFFTSWLDAEGYQVDYCVNADHDQQPNLLDDYPAHLRICHGEYSSRQDLSGVGLPAMPPPRACLCHCRVRRLTFLLDPSPSPGVRLGVSSTALRPPIDPDTGRQATKPY